MSDINEQPSDLLTKVQRLNETGIALSSEKDHQALLKLILEGAKELVNADGGTIYQVSRDQELTFEVLRNDSLGIGWGGPGEEKPPLNPVPLFTDDGKPNNWNVASYVVNKGETVNVADAYKTERFDFTGTKYFDNQMNYKSQSFLTVPLKNHEDDIIGALQLINARNKAGMVVPFSTQDQEIVESLASQAAIAMTNRSLIHNLHIMLESFITSIADAIDAKSPHTSQHCKRVPIIAEMIAESLNKCNSGPFAEFNLDKDKLYELKMASLLHDCGKVTTPVHVIDKATRLESLMERMELVDARFEILRRDAEVAFLKQKIECIERGREFSIPALEDDLKQRLEKLTFDQNFVRECNCSSVVMTPKSCNKIKDIALEQWTDSKGETHPLLNPKEVENLCIIRGTLNDEERNVINQHVDMTVKMLKDLPYPKHLKQVPEIAGSHHEKIDGSGYPNGITGDDMSVQAKILAIADIFEALTAKNRPYKQPMSVSDALAVLEDMKNNNKIDADIFDVFVKEKVYIKYCKDHVDPSQIDIEI